MRAHSTDGAGEPGGAEVLQADDPVARVSEQLEAGLHQQLLEEGVADLHGRAQLFEARLESVRLAKRRAVDAVAAGVGADEHEQVAGAVGAARSASLVVCGDADAHGVDQRVAVVGGGEKTTSPPTVGMPRQLP